MREQPTLYVSVPTSMCRHLGSRVERAERVRGVLAGFEPVDAFVDDYSGRYAALRRRQRVHSSARSTHTGQRYPDQVIGPRTWQFLGWCCYRTKRL